tara:strand:- start:1271 stop:1765 length:495 start_codon:yes stop_codon:yes gene_type:complete
MRYVGWTLVIVGVIDWLSSLGGIDFYGLFGIDLGILYQFSAYIVGGIGGIILWIVYKGDASSAIDDSLAEGEELLYKNSVTVKQKGWFKQPDTGVLYLTNRRIGYMGDEDLAFDSNLEDVSSITMKRWWIELTIADKTITFTPGMFKAKSLASQIENAMEAKAS